MVSTNTGLKEKLAWILESFGFIYPELLLGIGIILILIVGLIFKNSIKLRIISYSLSILLVVISSVLGIDNFSIEAPIKLFTGAIRLDDFSTFMKLLCDIGAVLALLMSFQKGIIKDHHAEYAALILTILTGAHLLLMSTNYVIIFIALEMISLSSYVITGFAGTKESAEGSFKYFVFGSVVSAVMLYGFSILYGLTGTLDFSTEIFVNAVRSKSILFSLAGIFSLAGFLFKIAAVPFHPWAPDVYESAPMPVVAYFSVVPKLAGLGILIKVTVALNLYGQSRLDWQTFVVVIAMLSILMGNFSALRQKSVKRMMAYSSIAQTGFLLTGLAAFSEKGTQFLLFYAVIYLIMNYLVFMYLQYFEKHGLQTMEDFKGTGKRALVPHVFLLIGFISLTGLPPTAGFMGKLFIFSGVWESYNSGSKEILLWLLIFGLVNTVISLFYYLRISFLAFLKPGKGEVIKYPTWTNFLGLILVFIVLFLFFQPNVLMSWINKINFAL